jgi:hypothetical protein
MEKLLSNKDKITDKFLLAIIGTLKEKEKV